MSIAYGPAVAIPGDHVAIATDVWTEPFWNAAKERRLTAAQCADCGVFRMPPGPFCPHCQSKAINWPTLPGTGTVFSFTICPRSPYPDVTDFTYVPVIVDLDGAPGARLVSNMIGINAGDVRIGMRVQVNWHDVADGWTLPLFRPLTDALSRSRR